VSRNVIRVSFPRNISNELCPSCLHFLIKLGWLGRWTWLTLETSADLLITQIPRFDRRDSCPGRRWSRQTQQKVYTLGLPILSTADLHEAVYWRPNRVFHSNLLYRTSSSLRQLLLLDGFYILSCGCRRRWWRLRHCWSSRQESGKCFSIGLKNSDLTLLFCRCLGSSWSQSPSWRTRLRRLRCCINRTWKAKESPCWLLSMGSSDPFGSRMLFLCPIPGVQLLCT
jgi:hypothetical protein